jgi:hypothetical protein
MSRGAASWLAWSIAALCIVLFVTSVALYALLREAGEIALSGSTGSVVDGLLISVPFLAFPLVGALIASRRPHNPIGWILLVDGLLWMLIDLTDYSSYGLVSPGTLPFPVVIFALSNWLWVPAVGLLGTFLILLFPDGKLPSRGWRILAWLAGAVIVVESVAALLAPGHLQNLKGVHNPFGLEGHQWVATVGSVVLALLPLCMLASAVSLVMRYRRSGGEVRQQIKWIAFSASVVGAAYLGLISAGLVIWFLSPPGTSIDIGTQSLWGAVVEDVTVLSFAGVPVAIGFAILNYRLYEIDIIINRALVYGSLTATLIALYFGGIVVLQRVFVLLTGEKSTLAVVASTLLIAALFTPLRRRIQGFIDRRFYRRKYDASKTLEAFTIRLRDETDLGTLSDDLVGVVRETMQPAHVSLWLSPETTPKGEHPH